MLIKIIKNPVIVVLLVLAFANFAYLCESTARDDDQSRQKAAQENVDSVAEEAVTETTTEIIENPPSPEPVPSENPPEPEVSKWPVTYSLNDAASLTVVVNKKHKLPSNYAPALQSVAGGQLRPEAANALQQMLNDASAAGVPMRIISSYRSYATQVSTYQKWVNLQGQTQADRSSARAGHSEHQTGLAVDLGMPDSSCDLLICFGDTAQGVWLAENSQNYGFIVRYEKTTESITGYQYEPWHMRYVGVETAQAVKVSGLTLDQYFNVEAGGY